RAGHDAILSRARAGKEKGPEREAPGQDARRRGLEPALEDLEVALLGLDDVVEESVDGGNLPVLVELVVEGRELGLVLEPEDFHEVVRPAAVLVDGAIGPADGTQKRLQLPHEIEELAPAALTDRVRDREEHAGIGELGDDQ